MFHKVKRAVFGPTAEEKAAAKTFRAAADLLEEHGWAKGRYGGLQLPRGGYSPMCAVGAINMVRNGSVYSNSCDGNPDEDPVLDALAVYGKIPKSRFMGSEGRVTRWNDQIAADGPTVIATLRAAADRLDGGDGGGGADEDEEDGGSGSNGGHHDGGEGGTTTAGAPSGDGNGGGGGGKTVRYIIPAEPHLIDA